MSVRMVRLEDVCEINPRAPKNIKDDTPVSFLPMSAVSEDGHVSLEEARTYGDVKKGYTYFERGDVLVAKITPCFENGKAASTEKIQNKLGFGSTEFHVLRPSKDLNPKYVFYLIWSERFRKIGEKGMTGSAGQKRVPADLLRRLEIPLPSLDEQKRIAAILDKADALRTKRRQAIALLDNLTQSIFLEMFGDPRHNISRFGKSTLLELGKVSTGKTPPTAEEKNFGSEIPFVTPGDLESGQDIKRFLSSEGAYFSKLVNGGAALVCCIGATIGKMDIARSRCAFNQQINAVEWGSRILPIFGLEALRLAKDEIISRSISTTLPILKKSEFEKIEIVVPSLVEQKLFSDRVGQAQVGASIMTKWLIGSDALFASLQHRAFTGQL